MTKLPAPEQWVLARMNEMEVAELIEQHIDFYIEDEEGDRRSVHLPMTVRARTTCSAHDGALPTVVAIATAAAWFWPTVPCWRQMVSIAIAASSSSFRRSCGQSSRSRKDCTNEAREGGDGVS